MSLNEKNNNFDNDKILKDKISQSKFVFSYSYGFLLPEKTNFTQLVVLDEEVVVKKRFSNTANNIDKSFQKKEQTKQIKDYFSQEGISNQLEVINNISPKDLKVYKNSRIDYVYLKIDGKEYKFEGNSANVEYRNFLQKIIKKVYSILNLEYGYSNHIYKVSINAPASWNENNSTEYGHPVFKFKPVNIPAIEILFKFYGVVSFSPALFGQYTMERIGKGTVHEYLNAFNNFVNYISSETDNYRLIKKEKIDFDNKEVNRVYINYVKSNITSIIDYVYFDNNIIVIGCPLTLNMTDEESLNSKNIEINNRIIKTIKIHKQVDGNEMTEKEIIDKIDKKIEELKQSNTNYDEEFTKLKNNDYISISEWYGKKEIVIEEKIVSLKNGAIYQLSTRKGNDDESKNYSRIDKICILHSSLISELRKYIVDEEKLLEIKLDNPLVLDKGTTIKAKIGEKEINIKNQDILYQNILSKIDELKNKNDLMLKDVSEKVNSNSTLIDINEANEKFKNANKSFFYIVGSMAKKDYKMIKLVENCIIKEEFIKGKDNSKVIIDDELSTKAWNIIDSRIDEIKKCSEEIQNISRIVDGYNDSIIVKYNNESYGFSSKVENDNIQRIYKEITTEILKYLDI